MATPTLTTEERNAAANAVVDLLDIGAGANATLELGNSDFSIIYLTFNLDGTNAFGDAAVGVASVTGTPSATGVVSGGGSANATHYRYKNKDGTVRRGAALDSAIPVTDGNTYDLTTATYTQPAS